VPRATVAARREMVVGDEESKGREGAAGEGTEFRVRPLWGCAGLGAIRWGRVVGGGVRKSGLGDV
jgi:hypothetical protein